MCVTVGYLIMKCPKQKKQKQKQTGLSSQSLWCLQHGCTYKVYRTFSYITYVNIDAISHIIYQIIMRYYSNSLLMYENCDILNKLKWYTFIITLCVTWVFLNLQTKTIIFFLPHFTCKSRFFLSILWQNIYFPSY